MSHTQILERLMRLAVEAGATELAAETSGLIQRAGEGRFYVACVGEFKRGKSTLINSLLGSSVLPTGVVPVTSVPTVLRYGEAEARVLQDGRWRAIQTHQLADYVSQERNPGNVKRVGGVEVFLQHSLLRDGLCLVDTPGLGSVFDANTASTVDFLPHVDAAVVVLGADPPISGEELRFVAELERQVDTLFFVLNKADRIPAGHRDEAVEFTRRVLEQTLGRAVPPIYEVSAIATERGPAAAHGWHALVAVLERLPHQSGHRLVEAAARRGGERLSARLAALLEEERRALVAPLAESKRRLAALTEAAAGAARVRRELEPLLGAEERALGQTFEQRRLEFLERTLPVAVAELEKRFDERLNRDAALELANEIARARLADWLRESERQAEGAYQEAVGRFAILAREFLERVATTAGIAQDAVGLDETVWSGFQAPPRFYFTDIMRHQSPLPWAWLVDRLTPRARARRLGAARRYLEDLMVVNSTRVESDLRDRVHESRRRLQGELDRLLREIGQAVGRAVERGRAAQMAGEAAARGARERLEHWLTELADLDGGTVARSRSS